MNGFIFEKLKLCRAIQHQSYLNFTGFPSSIVLSLRFYWWLLKLFTAWRQIIFTNWPAEGNQPDIPSDPAKKLCSRFQAARYSQDLVVEHSAMRPQSSGTTYLAKYPALSLCQILHAMWKHIFLNKLLICSSVFVSFILLFITYFWFYFIFKSFYLLVNFIHF